MNRTPLDSPSVVQPDPAAHEIATALLGQGYDALDPRAQKVARHVAARTHISREVQRVADQHSTLGQRAADAVAALGGSWGFVALFGATMLGWVVLNGLLLHWQGHSFDPYPYILLNLFLSMLAAIQAPVILMSQNRQAQQDRASAEHDYEVNLKAELEIMLLHQKIDTLRQTQWVELLALQRQQLAALARLERQRRQTGKPDAPARGRPRRLVRALRGRL